jgi:peptide/nickel transport system substrate-binding protein
MIQGELDWMGTGWDPTLDEQFTQKDPAHNHTWFPASNTVMLYLNLSKAPFSDLNVRKAISAAINRDNLPQGIAQYAKAANPTGVVIPNQTKWIKSDYQSLKFESADKVDGYMAAAGFTKTDGVWTKAGKKLSMNVDVVTGWNDWVQDVENIVSDLKKAGFDAKVNAQAGFTPYYEALTTGKYDAAISWTNSGPTPYFTFQALLSSANSAAAGKAVTGTNFMRWDATTSNGFSAQTDKLIADYEKAADEAGQMQAIQGIEDIMLSQLPCLPLTVNVFWGEYSTKNWTGFPSADNPYDSSAPYNSPDFVNVILHLKAATS